MTKTDTEEKDSVEVLVALTIGERFQALSLLPKQGNVFEMRTVKVLTEVLVPSEKEEKEYPITPELDVDGKTTGRLLWPTEKALVTTDIPMTPKAFTMLEAALKDLSERKKLEVLLLPLYDKFVKEA